MSLYYSETIAALSPDKSLVQEINVFLKLKLVFQGVGYFMMRELGKTFWRHPNFTFRVLGDTFFMTHLELVLCLSNYMLARTCMSRPRGRVLLYSNKVLALNMVLRCFFSSCDEEFCL